MGNIKSVNHLSIKRTQKIMQLMLLCILALASCILHFYCCAADNTTLFISSVIDTVLIFFIVVSLFRRQWALPVLTLRTDITLVGTLIMLYSITNSVSFIYLVIVPLFDFIRYFICKPKENVPVQSRFYLLSVIELVAFFIVVIVIAYNLVSVFAMNLDVSFILGLFVLLVGRIVVFIRYGKEENRFPWIFSVILIPTTILMRDVLTKNEMFILYIAVGMCFMSGLLDVLLYKNIYVITRR